MGREVGGEVWALRPSPPQPSSRPGWRSGKRKLFFGGGDVCRVITERSLIRAELGEDMVDGTWDGGEVGVVVGLSA